MTPGFNTVCPDTLPLARSRLADYMELTRPRLSVMVLLTVAAGSCLASAGAPNLAHLLHTVFGIALMVAGATALNQVLERHSDAQMERTRNRPLPAGRLRREEALLFGVILALVGLAYLALTVRQPLAIMATGFAFISYVFLYTPLKLNDAQHTGGSDPRRDIARHRLDGRDEFFRPGRGCPICGPVPLAGASFPGHRLDLS